MIKSTKSKYKKPCCPICDKNNNVISDSNGFSYGVLGVAKKGASGEGGSHSYLYCTKCFVDFDIKITYKKYAKDKRIGMTGNSGYQG